MLERYKKLPPGVLGKAQEQLERLFHMPVWYVFKGNLNNQKDLEEYTGILTDMIKNAKKFVHVYDIGDGEESFVVTDNAILINGRHSA